MKFIGKYICCFFCSNDDGELLIPAGKKRKSSCCLNFIKFLPCVGVFIFFAYNFFLWDTLPIFQCLNQFKYLNVFEENFGPLIKTYYLDHCYDSRVELPPQTLSFDGQNDVFLPKPPVPSKEQCSNISDLMKFECYPRGNASQQDCNNRGCCFFVSSDPLVPSCFYPTKFHSYKYQIIKKSENEITATLTAQFRSPYPNDIENLTLSIQYVSEDAMLIEIKDSNKPNQMNTNPFISEFLPQRKRVENPTIRAEIDESSTGFKIIRNSNNMTIFNTQDVGGLIYSKQFQQISAVLPSKYIYGLGERRGDLLLNTEWNTVTLFSHDSPPTNKVNGYGVFPFYLCIEEGGLSHGVAFTNDHAMDIILQPKPAITYRTIGESLSFIITTGSEPKDVVVEMSEVLYGKPLMPPYWSLGFHLSRFGHKTLDDMKKIWNQTRIAKIPFDTQWADLDYMDKRNDFTVDPVNYKDLKDFVQLLHQEGMRFVPIVDPGVSSDEAPGTYPPYDEGLKAGIFIMDDTGKKPYIGKVWNPKSTAFVDFLNPRALQYWYSQLSQFHEKVPFDGLWIDMNEPSNFMDGSGCAAGNLNNPPYVPLVEKNSLNYHTVCMSSRHFYTYHYNVHTMYGAAESYLTAMSLTEIRNGKRPFVISRSTQYQTSQCAGHWTGDVYSTWKDLKQSVKDLLAFSLFGQPLVGADICGFNGNTSAALCSRWFQLGAFYPFSRNHNSDDTIAQDPVSLGDEVVASARDSLTLRYLLLPYLYTLFWRANTNYLPLVRPLFFEFPKDNNTYTIEDQFMWGSALLVAPLLDESLTYTKVYLGKGTWYNWYTHEQTQSPGKLYADSGADHSAPLFLRAGHVVPLQKPDVTTTLSRQNPFLLKVGLDETGVAVGQLYWDDGETLGGGYNLINFSVSNGTLQSTIEHWGYETAMVLSSVTLIGVGPVKQVVLDNVTCPFNYTVTTKELKVSPLNVNLKEMFTMTWS